jgi:hypothetical protein
MTAACALAAEQDGGPPHVLLLPEIAFDEGRFLAKVEQAVMIEQDGDADAHAQDAGDVDQRRAAHELLSLRPR